MTDGLSFAPASLELADYGAALRRRWWLIVGALVLGTGLAVGFVVKAPKTYVSTASVLVQPTGADNGSDLANGRTRSPLNLDTESQVVRSTVVAARARTLLRSSTAPADLLRDVSVTVPANTSVLAISFSAPTASAAQHGAHAFAESYLLGRTDAAKANIVAQQKTLTAQIATLTGKQQQLAGQYAALPANSPDRTTAQAALTVVNNRLSSLQSNLDQLNTMTIAPGQIIDDAALPSAPTSPKVVVILASGIMGALLLGIVLAALAELADRRVHSVGELQRRLGLAALATMPVHRKQDEFRLANPTGPVGQAARRLANLLHTSDRPQSRVLLIAPASPGPGAGMVAANLAVTVARAGGRVLLVCADVAASTSARVLGLGPGPGLTEALVDHQSWADVARHPIEPVALDVLTAGSSRERTASLLQTEAAERLVRELREAADLVVIEAPAASAGPDAQTLAGLSDLAIVVAEVRRTRRGEVRDAVRQIERMGSRMLGAVVVPKQGKAKHRPPVVPAVRDVTRPTPTPAGSDAPAGPAGPPTDRVPARSASDRDRK